MSILEFITKVANDNKLLQQFREETSVAALTEDEIALDELQDLEEEEKEETVARKKHRHVSQTLIKLLHSYDKKLECENRSDLSCLLIYLANNIKAFDIPDLDVFTRYVKDLAVIANHLNPNSSTLRGFCVDLGRVFKQYFVTTRNEHLDNGAHTSIV